jgi:signal transduction histidine kinase
MLRILSAALLALFVLMPVPAAGAPFSLDAYHHTRWTPENGGPPTIADMAQTPDGWLWFATINGLYRFDGVAFEHVPLPAAQLSSRSRMIYLYAHDNGDLYISHFGGGLTLRHADGRVEDMMRYPGHPERPITSLVVDRDGSLWSMTFEATYHFTKDRWSSAAVAPGITTGAYRSLLLDPDGRLWLSTDFAVLRLDRASSRWLKVADHGGGLTQSPDGGVWLLSNDEQHTARLLAAAATPPRQRFLGQGAQARATGIFDADGALWAINCPAPLCVVPAAAQHGNEGIPLLHQQIGAQDQLLHGPLGGSGLLVDREGNIWLSSAAGLDRFRQRRLQNAGLPREGNNYIFAVDGDGQAWATERDSGALRRLTFGAAPQDVPGVTASAIATARDGALLVGTPRSIQWRRHGKVEEIALPVPPAAKDGLHLMGVLDDGKLIWAAAMETGLIAWDGKQWLPKSAFKLPPSIALAAAGGSPGQLWLGAARGALYFYDNGKLTQYDYQAIGFPSGLFPGREMLVSGEHGTGVLKNGVLQLLHAADPRVLINVSGMLTDAQGDHWLNSSAGIVHVRAQDWAQALQHPDSLLRYRVFDVLDGYPGQVALESRLPTAISTDGRHMWFAGTGGVVAVDTSTLKRNPVPPQPVIQNVMTADATYAATAAALRLPAGSQQLRLNFTAAALRMPERVKFQYRLQGIDQDWQDAGTRRMTMYNDVAPGDYVFKVRAINEDGTPSQGDATLQLSVAPTLTQSLPFRLGAVLLVLATGVMLYRYRIRYLTARLMERLVVKTAERERIARMLHDTILQTVQALMLRIDNIAAAMPASDPNRGKLEQVMQNASDAISEGRDQVHELRSRSAQAVEDLLAECIGGLRDQQPALHLELRLEGDSRHVHPVVVEEAGHIGSEAIRNACRHAQATRVIARVRYERRALTVVVEDNGQGLEPQVQRDGSRSGHWGMVGMRERAARIGARLAVDSVAGKGVTVKLSVPAARAYAQN